MTDLGFFIKSKREEKGWSQRQLAYKAKVSNTEIKRIEDGERKKPSPHVLEKLAGALGVEYGYMLSISGYNLPVKGNQGASKTIAPTPDDLKKLEYYICCYKPLYINDFRTVRPPTFMFFVVFFYAFFLWLHYRLHYCSGDKQKSPRARGLPQARGFPLFLYLC